MKSNEQSEINKSSVLVIGGDRIFIGIGDRLSILRPSGMWRWECLERNLHLDLLTLLSFITTMITGWYENSWL